MYTEHVPMRVIDLGLDASIRWGWVLVDDHRAMKALAKQARKDMTNVSPLLDSPLLQWLIKSLFFNNPYSEEIESLAGGLGVSATLAALLNHSYELSHMGTHFSIFGCTAGLKRTKDGVVLVRNLDWPLSKVGAASRIFQFLRGARRFITVGVAGYVGVLSGMLPGRYAVSLNWAPPPCSPALKTCGPAILLRQVFEFCDSYKEAVEMLSQSPLSTSAFYTVCGTDEGCVIERLSQTAVIWSLGRDVLVQANHFRNAEFQFANSYLDDDDETECLDFSKDRAAQLQRRLRRVKTMKGAFRALDEDYVLNETTVQQMAFCPTTGEMRVGRWA